MNSKGKTAVTAASYATILIFCIFQLYSQSQKYYELIEELEALELNNNEIDQELQNVRKENDNLLTTQHKLNEILELQASELEEKEKEIKKLKKENKKLEEKEKEIKKLKKENKKLKKESKAEKASEKEWMEFVATYYDANEPSTGKKPGDPGYGITASGRKVEAGVTIAVDPNVIPLGSWVLIQYPDGRTEKRRADDTGSAIKGNKIDIYIPKASITSGKHKVKVKIL